MSQRSMRQLVAGILMFVASSLMASSAAAQVAAESPSVRSSQEELAPGQSSHPHSDLKTRAFLRSFSQDEWRMWTSPFRGATYRSRTVKKYGLPFLLLSSASLATDRRTGSLLPNTVDQTKWSGRVSQLGASYTVAGISGAGYLFGGLLGNKHLKETGALGLQAIAHTQIIVFAIKQGTNRQRPLTSEGHGSFWKGGSSFPSGHAATSFALATVFAYEYRQQIAVPITAYTLATAVAVSRLSAQRHWVSDIFVGSSLGFLIGRYVYKNHHDPNLPGSPVSRTGRLIPDCGVGRRGFFCIWNL